MQHVSLTPFGRQPVTSALLAARQQGAKAPALPHIDKWSLFSDLRIARDRFGISDRDLAVLYALLTFLPGKQLSSDMALVVFPSNASLSDRAHGMAESTLRRHLAALVEAGLIWRQDSPNGKRFARRDSSGTLAHAYGFDLRPLLHRAEEIAITATEVTAEAETLRLAREALVLRLRDAAKLIAYGPQMNLPGDWVALEERLQPLRKALRRKLTADLLGFLDDQARKILAEASSLLALESENSGGYAVHFGCHHTESNKDIPESETGSEPIAVDDSAISPAPAPNLPLQLVLEACPDIRPYAPNSLRSWRDLVVTACELRGMMGISAGLWSEAQEAMGAEGAAITLSAMLQRFETISNPAGYLRSLSRKAASRSFSPAPMIMALLRDARGPARS